MALPVSPSNFHDLSASLTVLSPSPGVDTPFTLWLLKRLCHGEPYKQGKSLLAPKQNEQPLLRLRGKAATEVRPGWQKGSGLPV